MTARRDPAARLAAVGFAPLLAAVCLALVCAVATAFPASASAATAETVTPLPSSDYTVRAICSPPAPGRASCLALQLEPQTAEARARTHPLGVARARRRAPAAAPSPAAGYFGLRPQDLHSAYQLPDTASGSQTIALVDAYNDPQAESDLKGYDEEFGLPECTAANGCFKQVNQNGETGNPSFPKTLSELESAGRGSHAQQVEAEEAEGWGLEISLDIEVAHATCQSCEILLAEAETASYADLEAAERSAADLGAGEISNSWSGPEAGETPGLESASPFNHPGVVIAAATGDEGYLNWDGSAGERGSVGYPASSPHVVAVGGTRLTLGEHGEWSGEVVWNGDGATGGGCSSVFTAQPWQQSLPNWSAVGCGSKRAEADVSADADPFTGVAVHYTNPECEYSYTEAKVQHVLHWCTIGGTSLATPLISAVYALAGGAGGVSYPAQTLYEDDLASPASLHDVTSGSNGKCTKPFKGTGLSGCTIAEEAKSCDATAICVAGTGYDGPTGLGTPDGITAFEPPSSPPPPPAPTVVTGSASAVTQTGATLAATVDPNGSEVKACKLEYGLTSEYGSSVACTPSPGSGDSAVAVSGSVSTLLANKTYHFRVLATNAGGTSYGGAETFTTLPYAPVVVTGSASGVSQTAATLSGSVNPNGAEVTACKLEYGLSTAYEASVPCTPSPGSGESAVSVNGSAAGLAENETYDFRVVAVNAGGTGYGGNRTFTTLASPPPPPGPPEFGRCVKVIKGAGKYANASCTRLGGADDYEWEPGIQFPGFTTKSTSAAITLEPATGSKVTCTGETSAGRYSGSNTVADVVLTFTGCERAGETCSSGLTAGEVASSPLEGVLGIEKLGATSSKDKIGLALSPPEEGTTVTFSCGLTNVSVAGSVIVPVAADKMSLAQTLKFKAKKGKQKPQSFAGGPDESLEASLDDAAPVQLGLTMTSTLTSEEPVEINTVV
ncbi:MAG TPA: hypothetical protein VMB51_08300 [Solirubrobacteraceae bacterium]|nr:hypothetical protein [Solirubrobacteraceae bacterium]